MENNYVTHEPKGSAWSVAFKYGLIGGIGLVAISLLMYLTGMEDMSTGKSSWISSLLNYGVMMAAIALGIQAHRNQNLSGNISFGGAFKTGFFISLILALVSMIWIVVYLNVIDPSALDVIQGMAAEEMEDMGDEELEMVEGMMGMFMSTPFFMAVAFLGTLFTGTIMSLIGGAIFKTSDSNAGYQ